MIYMHARDRQHVALTLADAITETADQHAWYFTMLPSLRGLSVRIIRDELWLLDGRVRRLRDKILQLNV